MSATRPRFYDPGFAVATALLSLVGTPLWVLAYGVAGVVISAVFALALLAFMLWQSWKMARCGG